MAKKWDDLTPEQQEQVRGLWADFAESTTLKMTRSNIELRSENERLRTALVEIRKTVTGTMVSNYAAEDVYASVVRQADAALGEEGAGDE